MKFEQQLNELKKIFNLNQHLKTYEEIWLSKTFQMIPYQTKQVKIYIYIILYSSSRIYLF